MADGEGVLTTWLDNVSRQRDELIEATKTGNRIRAAFAEAEARAALLESLNNEEVRIRLLRITDPKLDFVELVNAPTDEDRVRVCATAILSGFTPGEDEFSIYGGSKKRNFETPGKLYVKEAGYRKLFAHLGVVPDVHTAFPQWAVLNNGKGVWRVTGRASCLWQGKRHTVEREGDNAIGFSGYDSDNIASIDAKARRRFLQMLWQKVSPVMSANHAVDVDEEGGSVTVTEPAKLEDEWQQYLTPFAEAPDDIRQAAEGVRRMSSTEDIRAAYASAQELHKKAGLSKRYVDAMRHLCQFAEGRLQA